MARKQAYKTNVEIAFVGSEYIEIDRNKIVYVAIMHNYEEQVMPVIYIAISINQDLYIKIVDEKDSAKIFLRIQKYDAYSDTSLSKDYIKRQFSYVLSSTAPEYSKDLSDKNSNVDSNYKTIIIGLVDTSIINALRITFGGEGPLKNIDQHTLINKAIEDTKIIIKDPVYNIMYSTLNVPPITSRKQMLEYIFDQDPFYDTEFLYFMDFDTSYLLDRTGEAVHANDGQLDDIIIDVKAVTMQEAYNEGMEIRNNAYYFYVNPANTKVSMNMGIEKVANQLIAGDEDSTTIVDMDVNRSVDSNTKQTFRRMEENTAVVYKNAMQAAQVCIEMVKENIDARYITPNKCISINNYEGYNEYNGKYNLLYKKEVIQGASNDFVSIVTIGVKKVGNIQKIGLAGLTAGNNTKTTSTTARSSNYTKPAPTPRITGRTTRTSSRK